MPAVVLLFALVAAMRHSEVEATRLRDTFHIQVLFDIQVLGDDARLEEAARVAIANIPTSLLPSKRSI